MSRKLRISDKKVIGNLKEMISSLDSPVDKRGAKYSTEQILSCIAMGLIQTSNDFRNIEKTLSENEEEITKFLGMSSIPSDDTLMRRLERVDSKKLSQLLNDSDKSAEKEYIIIDGKAIRAGAETSAGKIPPYVLNAKSNTTGKCLGAVHVGEKESEKVKALELIEQLNRKGVVFGADANINTAKVRELINETDNFYVFVLKDNNKNMKKAAQSLFEEVEFSEFIDSHKQYYLPAETKVVKSYDPEGYSTLDEMGSEHGREEYRKYSMLELTPEIRDGFDEDIKAVGKVERKRKYLKPKRRPKKKALQKQARRQNRRKPVKSKKSKTKKPKTTLVEEVQVVYYIMNFVPETIQEFAGYVRGEWDIENRLHYILDETFKEDRSTVKSDVLRLNMALMRRLIFNLLLSVGLEDEESEGETKTTPLIMRVHFTKNISEIFGIFFGPFSEFEHNALANYLIEASTQRILKSLDLFRKRQI